jgi:hypothetical protein
MTGDPPSGLKIDEIDKIASEACTRSGAFALLVSVLLLVLCVSLQGRKADRALADYVAARQNLAMFAEELQKDQIWQQYAESHTDADQKPLAQLIHTKVDMSRTSANTGLQNPAGTPSRSIEPHSPNSSDRAPLPPSGLTVSMSAELGELSEMSHIVQSWRELNDLNLLTRSSETSNYFSFSIAKWANRRANLMYDHVRSGTCMVSEFEMPPRLFKSEHDVRDLSDEALMNCVTMRDLRELAQFELPQLSVPAQLGTKIGRDVDLSPGSLPKDPYAASLVAEALLFFALVYFSAFVREAVSSDSFPARGTLFGAFSRTRGVLAVFFVALWAPFLSCCAVGFTSGQLLLGLAALPVLVATFSAHQTLAGKSFFESIRPSALLASFRWHNVRDSLRHVGRLKRTMHGNESDSQEVTTMSDAVTPRDEQENWSYYYALYFNLAHWTGSLTILVFMISAGILLSVPHNGTIHRKTVAIALLCLCGTQFYLGWRIRKLGPYVRRRLKAEVAKPDDWELWWVPWIYGIVASSWILWIIFR